MRVEERGTVVRISIDRPARRNAISSTLARDLARRIRTLTGPQRVLLLSGTAGTFSSGLDLDEVAGSTPAAFTGHVLAVQDLLTAMLRTHLVTVAWIDGPALGAGADLALACDHRLVSERARFAFPGFRLGLALGTRRLGALAGGAAARRVLLRDEPVTAAEAVQLCLAEAVAGTEDELLAWVDDLAGRLGRLSADQARRLVAVTRCTDVAEDVRLLTDSLADDGVHAAFVRHAAAGRGSARTGRG